MIRQEKEKKQEFIEKQEKLKDLNDNIDEITKNIKNKKQELEKAEAEEQAIIKRENEFKEKKENRVLMNREKVVYEVIENLENEDININEKDYFFRKVPFFQENFYDVKDKGYFVGYVTDFFKTIKSNLLNYKEEYREILKEIKTEILQGARAFNNFVREKYPNVEIDEEKTVSVKEKEKASDEKEKEKEKDYIEY